MSRRLKAVVQKTYEGSQSKKAHALVIESFFGARGDFTNNRGCIADARRMVHRLGKNLEMPVVKCSVPAISRFRSGRITQPQPASQRDNLIFEAAQLLFAQLIKVCAMRDFERRVV